MLPHLANQAFSFGVSDVARAMFSGLNSFTLLAVPMFMVSGMIMARGGISKKLFNFFGYFIGNKTAGFPCAVVVTCMFYAAISGSSPATVSAVGSMTIPFLVAKGYDKIFATSIVTVAGGLGVIIPPSISYIVYASIANCSPSNSSLPESFRASSLALPSWFIATFTARSMVKINKNFRKAMPSSTKTDYGSSLKTASLLL